MSSKVCSGTHGHSAAGALRRVAAGASVWQHATSSAAIPSRLTSKAELPNGQRPSFASCVDPFIQAAVYGLSDVAECAGDALTIQGPGGKCLAEADATTFLKDEHALHALLLGFISQALS